jgi:ribosome maturation factor RimP
MLGIKRQTNRRQKMSKREDYESRTEALLEPIASSNGVSIYDVEYVKEGSEYYLRAYIDKPEGVNILDCENVSRALSDALDKEDFIPDAYILEVSSPGLGRTLKKDKHLAASIGQEVELKLFKPVDKCKEFSGELESFDAENITVVCGGERKSFKRSDIALIRLALDF